MSEKEIKKYSAEECCGKPMKLVAGAGPSAMFVFFQCEKCGKWLKVNPLRTVTQNEKA